MFIAVLGYSALYRCFFKLIIDVIFVSWYNSRYNLYADVAQLVEQLIRNEQVAGSTPFISSSRLSLHAVRTHTLWVLFVFCLRLSIFLTR
jgi:hypothetical protein